MKHTAKQKKQTLLNAASRAFLHSATATAKLALFAAIAFFALSCKSASDDETVSDATSDAAPDTPDVARIPDFITTWKTTIDGESVTIPTTGIGYDYNVDCDGDGIDDLTHRTGNAVCTYPKAGTHQISISGDFPRIYFNHGGDKGKLISIDNWGTGKWTSMNRAFAGCENVTLNAKDAPDLSGVTDISGVFYDAIVFNGDLSNWDVSNIRDMTSVFNRAMTFNGDLSGWDTSNVTKMGYMFQSAEAFNGDLSGWDTSNVGDMRYMFYSATAFNGDVSGWDVSSARFMHYMFQNAVVFNQNISGWKTLSAEWMGYMFNGAAAFSQDLSGWNVAKVTVHTDFNVGAPLLTTAKLPNFP